MFYLGMDVSKAKLDCCLLPDPLLTKRKSKSVANTKAGVAELLTWLTKQGAQHAETHVVMEGTGVYHELAAYALHDAGVCVSIANPAQVRHFAKGLAIQTKNDGVDSFVLARYAAMLQPKPWSPPPLEARQLQALLSRRDAISQDLQREYNRKEKADIADVPKQVSTSITESIRFLDEQLKALQTEIDDHIDGHPRLKKDLELLQSIPAVGPQTGRTLLAVMHSKNFTCAEQLAAFLGVVPIERQSGTSVLGKPRLSKTGPARVRAVLYMAAIVATQYNPHIKAQYENLLKRGKTKMSALGAAMRKLVHLCFGVIKHQAPYDAHYT